MTDADTVTVEWEGKRYALTREQFERLQTTGLLPGEQPRTSYLDAFHVPALTAPPPTSAALPKTSPARDSLIAALEQRGFTREVPFGGVSGVRRFRFDAGRADLKIGVDYHGFGGFKGQAHTSKKSKANDHDKLNETQLCGWLYLVCNSTSVASGQCLHQIDKAVALRERTRSYDEATETPPRGQTPVPPAG